MMLCENRFEAPIGVLGGGLRRQDGPWLVDVFNEAHPTLVIPLAKVKVSSAILVLMQALQFQQGHHADIATPQE